MNKFRENSTLLLQPNWKIKSARGAKERILRALLPSSSWKETEEPGTEELRRAIAKLEARGHAGDDYIEIQHGRNGTQMRVTKLGDGRFLLQVSGGPLDYLIVARGVGTEETLSMVSAYSSCSVDWMYSLRWESGKGDHGTEPRGGGEDTQGYDGSGDGNLFLVAFLPVVGFLGVFWGGGAGYYLGIIALTFAAGAVMAWPIIARSIMDILDRSEIRDNGGGFVRLG